MNDFEAWFDPSDVSLDRELVKRGGLREFVELAWHIVEPKVFIPNWHIDEICSHLEAISRREIARLVINVPPSHSKSLIVSVLWPAWYWIHDPAHKWMFATFSAENARRDALKCRKLVRSNWYRERWPHVAIDESADVQTTQGIYYTTAKGLRYSTTPGGGGMGWHCDTQVVDDPTKPADVSGPDPDTARRALKETSTWWQFTMASRTADASTFARVCIMQRLHEDDLAGELVKEGYTHLMLPARFEPERACHTVTDDGAPLGGDRRTYPGELLNPIRFPAKVLDHMETVEMGAQTFAAQEQQRPSPAEGNIFRRDWFRNTWSVIPNGCAWGLSVDCSFKDSATADYVAMGVWAFKDATLHFIDRVYRRLGLPDTVDKIQEIKARYPRISTIAIEDKANGPAVEQVLRKRLMGIVMLTPEGGKVARANASSPFFRAGNVLMPSLDWAVCPRCGTRRTDFTKKCPRPIKDAECGYDPRPWLGEYVENMVGFPFAANDDDVDQTTQIALYYNANSADSYIKGVEEMHRQMMGGK